MQTHRIFLIDVNGQDRFHPDRNTPLGHLYKHKKDYKPIHELLSDGWFPIRETPTDDGILVVMATYTNGPGPDEWNLPKATTEES
jgi:hypothetical protein